MELLSEEIEAVKMALPKVGYTLIFNEFRQNFKQFLHYEIQRHILGLIFFVGDQYGGDREGPERAETDSHCG